MPVKDPVKPPPTDPLPPPDEGTDADVAAALALAAAAEQAATAEQAAPAGAYKYEVTTSNFAPHAIGDVVTFDEPVTNSGWLHHLRAL